MKVSYCSGKPPQPPKSNARASFSALSVLRRYSRDGRKKCDNGVGGRGSVIYVTLRRNFARNLTQDVAQQVTPQVTQPWSLPAALTFVVSACCRLPKFRLAIHRLANHRLANH